MIKIEHSTLLQQAVHDTTKNVKPTVLIMSSTAGREVVAIPAGNDE